MFIPGSYIFAAGITSSVSNVVNREFQKDWFPIGSAPTQIAKTEAASSPRRLPVQMGLQWPARPSAVRGRLY